MQSEETWMELHVLHDHGWSIAALAREFGLDWRTARRYARTGKPPRYRPRTCPAQLTEAQLAHIERRLAGCPNLRVTVLIRELAADYGYTSSYTSLRRRVNQMRPRENSEPVIRFETAPGVQTQGDVNGHVEVPVFGHEKSPPGMAVRALAVGHLLGFGPRASGMNHHW
jgi:transposase